MLWTETGVDGKIKKDFGWNITLNSRFGDLGINTFFPQAEIEYKVKKWLKTSVEYRYILDKELNGNYTALNRMNVNLYLKKGVERFDFGCRIRYQNSFIGLSPTAYNADFDNALRVRPKISYDIHKSLISPEISGEFFYDPTFGKHSPGFNKMRLAAGVDLKLKKPHAASVKYQLDRKFFDYAERNRHVIALSYTYTFR